MRVTKGFDFMRNVVFDFGKVLVHYEPSYMVGKYVSDAADSKLLEEVVFDRLYWDRLDAGTITDGEAMECLSICFPTFPNTLRLTQTNIMFE